MNLRDFEALALEYWEEIPETYKEGVDGVRVVRRAKPHGELPDVYTMGECVTEAYPSDFGGPDTIRSAVVLYHGSFAALAHLDDEFDWDEELWETLTHELRHHLESLATEDALEDVDYAADESFKRDAGEAFDPSFYRAGEPVRDEQVATLTLGGGRPTRLAGWHVEGQWFVELPWSGRPPSGPATFDWLGARYAFELPAAAAEIAFVALGDGFTPPSGAGARVEELTLVLVRTVSGWRAIRALFSASQRSTEELVVDVTTEIEP